MRIRKNAKKSPLVYVDAHLNPGFILKTQCPLNQNPWDVMSFSPPSSPPPSSSRVKKIDAPVIGNNSMDMIVAVEREEIHDAGRKRNHHNCDNNTVVDCMTEKMVDKPMGWGGKTNKRSRGSINSNSHCPIKEKQPMTAEATPFSNHPQRKKASGSSSNTDEFYYYSCFRPCWGKTGVRHGGTNGGELSPMIEEDSDCVDPIEDEEMVKKTSGKKRGRKSVKTRSLKSLM